MRKPEVGQVWRVCDGGGLWVNVVLVEYKPNRVGGSWLARDLTTWKQRWLDRDRWDPTNVKSKLTGYCSLDPEFYSPFQTDTVGSVKKKIRP